MLLIHLCFFLFSFLCPAFCSYILFYFCSHVLLLALLYMFLLFCSVGFWEWMGKGIAFARFFGSIRKRRKLYMFFGHAFFGFLWEVCLTTVGSCWWSQPSWICGKGGNFLYFWARKGFYLWSFGGLEQWYFLYLLCYFFFSFLSHLSVLNCA